MCNENKNFENAYIFWYKAYEFCIARVFSVWYSPLQGTEIGVVYLKERNLSSWK